MAALQGLPSLPVPAPDTEVAALAPHDVAIDIKSHSGYGSFEEGKRESKDIDIVVPEPGAAAAGAGAGAGAGAPGGPVAGLVVNVSDDPDHPVLRPVLDKQQSLEHTSRSTPQREKDPLTDMAKSMVKMGFDEDISMEALRQTRMQSVELAVERVFRIQGEIDRLERALTTLERENPHVVGPTPRAAVTFANMADSQRLLETERAAAAAASARDHWACERCTFLNKEPSRMCAVCEFRREERAPAPVLRSIGIPLPVAGPVPSPASILRAPALPSAAEDVKVAGGGGDTVPCLICFDDIPRADIVTALCGHDYCSGCWSGFLVDRVNDGRVMKITCPDVGCNRELKTDEVKRRIPADLVPKYERFLASAELSLDGNVRWCQTPGCETAMRGTKSKPRLTCPKCSASICFNCNEAWHGSRSCEAAGDAIMAAYRRENGVKNCPQCRAAIERSAGCNHMTCAKCRYEFCWMCRGRYSSNHFAPWNIFGCPGLQSGPLAFIADDNCGCNLSCGCGVCGFIKRFFFRLVLLICLLLAIGIGLPLAILCCPCIVAYIVLKNRY